jgi:ATP-dependent RNA helicase RhlE
MPTEVQIAAIPPAIDGRDLIVSARTGSGKTVTFALPMIERFAGRKGTYGLVLAPVREIALQIVETFKKIGEPLGVRAASLIGGVDYNKDRDELAQVPQVLVATPGRLCDHIEQGNLWLEYIEMVALDEADRMLDMGFSKELGRIVDQLGRNRQTLMYSATMPPSVEKLARMYLRDDAERISVGNVRRMPDNVKQRLVWVDEKHKISRLSRLLEQEKGTVIIFVRTKEGASQLLRRLHKRNHYDITAIHSNLEQRHREQALTAFKEGRFRGLIATDVAGRGIHVEGVAHVINFDVPIEAEDYVHRIGRTGRIDATTGQMAPGRATTFATPRERDRVQAIESYIKRALPERFDDEQALESPRKN